MGHVPSIQVLVVTGALVAMFGWGGPAAIEPSDIEVVGGTEQQRAKVRGFLELWHGSGLALPEVSIDFTCPPPERESIRGRWYGGEGRVCLWNVNALLHELGHAYDHQYLTDEERQKFMHEFGFETWLGREKDYMQRAGEIAANAIVTYVERGDSIWGDFPVRGRMVEVLRLMHSDRSSSAVSYVAVETPRGGTAENEPDNVSALQKHADSPSEVIPERGTEERTTADQRRGHPH
jgi:hypothetical protein